jgi:hypothetical protein
LGHVTAARHEPTTCHRPKLRRSNPPMRQTVKVPREGGRWLLLDLA